MALLVGQTCLLRKENCFIEENTFLGQIFVVSLCFTKSFFLVNTFFCSIISFPYLEAMVLSFPILAFQTPRFFKYPLLVPLLRAIIASPFCSTNGFLYSKPCLCSTNIFPYKPFLWKLLLNAIFNSKNNYVRDLVPVPLFF